MRRKMQMSMSASRSAECDQSMLHRCVCFCVQKAECKLQKQRVYFSSPLTPIRPTPSAPCGWPSRNTTPIEWPAPVQFAGNGKLAQRYVPPAILEAVRCSCSGRETPPASMAIIAGVRRDPYARPTSPLLRALSISWALLRAFSRSLDCPTGSMTCPGYM